MELRQTHEQMKNALSTSFRQTTSEHRKSHVHKKTYTSQSNITILADLNHPQGEGSNNDARGKI
jgi:hypothetical protein